MSSLYEVVRDTVDSSSMDMSRKILFGFGEFSTNMDEYYKRIISSFVRKKDIIINQIEGKLIFNLENVNDLWSMSFISEYIKKEIEKIELRINEQIAELKNQYETLQQQARTERINLGKELKIIGKQKKILEKQLEEALKCKSGFFDLETFPYSIEFEQNIHIKQELLKKIKESIKSIHILRNVIEHGNIQNKNDIIINNYGIQISIPYTYIDGFNKGKIIAIDTPENLERKVSNNNSLYITVEDTENKMDTIKEKIPQINKIELMKENEDGTKQYVLETNADTDLRKIIFSEFAKENITIFEMKQADATLEDAFMKLIEGGEK